MATTSPALAGAPLAAAPSTSAVGATAGGGGDPPTTSEAPPAQRLSCTVEGCGKSFGKASHLKRHVDTHNDAHPYQCSYCEKRFKRRDVCTRHENSLHKGKTAESMDDRPRTGTSPPPKKRARSGSSSSNVPHTSPAPPFVSLAPPVFPPPAPAPHPQPPPAASSSNQFPFALPPVHPPQGQITRPPSPLWQPQWSLHSEKTSAALSNMAPYDLFPPSSEAVADVTSSFDASLGWGYNDTELDLLNIFASNGSGTAVPAAQPSRSGNITPAINWLRLLGGAEAEGSVAPAAPPGPQAGAVQGGGGGGGRAEPSSLPTPAPSASLAAAAAVSPTQRAAPSATTPTAQATSPAVAALSAEADSLATPSDGGGPEAPSHNPWPHVYEPIAASADPLSLPSVANPPPLLLFEQPNGAVSTEIRQAMMQFVSDSHRSPWWAVSLASFPSAAILSSCVELYITRFHDTFPILDPVALGSGHSSPILLLACAAVGAMYRPEFEGLGVALTEVVRRTALWKREQDPRSFFEVNVIQAWLLSSISGLFCGSRKLYQHAEIARAGLATAARRMNLLRESTSFVQDLLDRKTPTESELQAAQKEDELRLRLGWGIYIFDNLVSVLLNLQPVVSTSEVAESTFLPEDTLLPPASTTRRRFRETLARLLTEGQLDGFLPPLATTIMQLTLYRLCLDASYADTVLSAVMNVQRSGTYRLVFPPDFKQNPQELLDRIGIAWHTSASAITPLHVQTTALAYHATLQFSCPDFLSLSKVCAGKYGSQRAMDAREAVTRLAVTHPVAVRRVLARAVQLSALLERHRYDTPAEVVWIADAAMAVWAIVKFARTALAAPSPLEVRSTIHWSDSRSIEPWIQHGGPLALRNGLGDFDTVTPEGVLKKFAERLEDHVPWGLAKKYRAVLLQLCLPE